MDSVAVRSITWLLSAVLMACEGSHANGTNDGAAAADAADASDAAVDAGELAACRSQSDIAAIPGIRIPALTGLTDPGQITQAIQTAIDQAMMNQEIVYLPAGDYTVTDVGQPTPNPRHAALICHQVAAPVATHALDGRFHPCVIVGSTCDPAHPSRLVLDSGASVDATLLYIWNEDTGLSQFNENYNHVIRGLVLDTRARDAATALDFRAAQGSTVQDTTIDMTGTHGHGLAGGPGSGGSIVNVTILGGDVGLDYSRPGEQTTVTAVTLRGQNTAAVLKGGEVTFVGVGLRIEDFNGATAIDNVTTAAASSGVTLVDSTIAFASTNVRPTRAAIATAHTAYVENVYVQNATDIVTTTGNGSGIAAPTGAAATDWVEIADAAVASDFGSFVGTDGITYRPTSHIWGVATSDPAHRRYVGVVTPGVTPSPTLAGSNFGGGGAAQHAWSHLVDFESPSAIVLAPSGGDDAAMIQSALDAHATDGRAIVLARGEYFLQHTLHLHAASQLVGLGPTVSLLEPDGATGAFATVGPQPPLVDTEVGGDTLLAYVGLYNDPNYQPRVANANATAVVWSGGANSRFVSPFPNFLNNTVGVAGPLFDIPGGGHFYNVWGAQQSLKKASSYRVYRISGQHAHFYEFDIEHASQRNQTTYAINAEITTGASDVRLYGVKDESGTPAIATGTADCQAIYAHDATDIRMYGGGGNGTPGTAHDLYYFTNVSSSRLANVVEAFDQHNGPLGGYSILRIDATDYAPLERPALVVIP